MNAPDFPQLTPAERRIAELLLCAQSPGAIARALHWSPDTVKRHLSKMYWKFGLRGHALYVPRVKLALLIHERHEALGVRCQTWEYLHVRGPSCGTLIDSKIPDLRLTIGGMAPRSSNAGFTKKLQSLDN